MDGYYCQYDAHLPNSCREEKCLDFDFCPYHLNTPRGRQHMLDVVQSGNLTRPSEIRSAVQAASELPEKDIQTTALEAASEALERILEWENECRNRLYAIPVEDWRYLSRERTEQKRTELTVYENAQERSLRALAGVSKMALKEKMVALGRGQSELMIKILMKVVNDLQLEAREAERARLIMLDSLRKEANLPSKVQGRITEQLSAPKVIESSP